MKPIEQRSSARSAVCHCRRRGIALAAALAEFAIVATILFAVLQSMAGHHRQMLAGRQQLQLDWLTQAGVDRAAAQLRHSPAYRGETWHVPAEELDGENSADVQIQLDPVTDQAGDLQLTVQAQYPLDDIHGHRQTRQATIHLK